MGRRTSKYSLTGAVHIPQKRPIPCQQCRDRKKKVIVCDFQHAEAKCYRLQCSFAPDGSIDECISCSLRGDHCTGRRLTNKAIELEARRRRLRGGEWTDPQKLVRCLSSPVPSILIHNVFCSIFLTMLMGHR